MSKYTLALAFVLGFTTNLSGQVWLETDGKILGEMRNILATKDFLALQNKVKATGGPYWIYFRDITPDFKEGIISFGYSVPDKDTPSLVTEYSYKVDIITTNSTITYYKLSDVKFKKVGADWRPYYVMLDSFKNVAAYDALTASFNSLFHTEIKENELFLTEYVYGTSCGYGGSAPNGRKQVEKLVAKNDRAGLLKWLKSVNTEKQIYAIDGLLQLKLKGMKITEEELKMIQFVANKKGNMQICLGCLFDDQEISTVSKELKF